MKTFVYVDGFNLYYGAVKGTPYKWLNVHRLCQLLLPKNEIIKIKYFTALVTARPGDPEQPNRQQIYLRALRTIPGLEIVYGHFLEHEVMMPVGVLNPRPASPSHELRKYATFVKPIRSGVLAASQFPANLSDRVGTFYKPSSW